MADPAARAASDPVQNLRGGGWLLADMALNIWALSIVKMLGAGYPAAQVVFLRAAVGLVLIAPLIWRARADLRATADLPLHLVRVCLSVITLTASFFAIARVPFALFTAIGFTRPLITMLMAALLLGETIGRRRWIAAGVALLGVLIALSPGAAELSWGLAALGVTVVAGSGAIIATRRLRAAQPIVLMAFYTAGLTLSTAPLAWFFWQPVDPAHWGPLLLVGAFAQAAQACFLRAHAYAEAGFLSVLGYLSLVLSTAVGIAVFNEVPTVAFGIGACLVIGAALSVGTKARTPPR